MHEIESCLIYAFAYYSSVDYTKYLYVLQCTKAVKCQKISNFSKNILEILSHLIEILIQMWNFNQSDCNYGAKMALFWHLISWYLTILKFFRPVGYPRAWSSGSGTSGLEKSEKFRVRVVSGLRILKLFGLGYCRAWKNRQKPVGLSGSGKLDPSLKFIKNVTYLFRIRQSQ